MVPIDNKDLVNRAKVTRILSESGRTAMAATDPEDKILPSAPVVPALSSALERDLSW